MDDIKISQLSFQYPFSESSCLNNITCTFKSGTCSVILGKNNSGKSTLLHLLKGYFKASSGKIRIGERLLEEYSDKDRVQKIVCLLQNPFTQFCQDSVYEELAFPLENLGISVDEIHLRVQETLDYLGITHLQDQDPSTLSGGQLQLVAFGALHILDPDIYLLDEPSSHLDQKTSEHLYTIIQELVQKGKTIIITDLYHYYPKPDAIFELKSGQLIPYTVKNSTPISYESKTQATGDYIIFDKVCVTISGTEILKNISFGIKKGTHVGILGHTGAGKSTLLKSINGILKPSSGFIYIENENIINKNIAQLSKKIGSVFQNPDNQIFHSRVINEILYNLPDSRFLDIAIQLTELEPYLNQNPYDLSFIQRKWISLACVIARNPDIYLFDEPTSGQDEAGLKRLINIYNYLSEQNKTILTISHNKEFISQQIPFTLNLKQGVLISSK